jgi:hypothetical protein
MNDWQKRFGDIRRRHDRELLQQFERIAAAEEKIALAFAQREERQIAQINLVKDCDPPIFVEEKLISQDCEMHERIARALGRAG